MCTELLGGSGGMPQEIFGVLDVLRSILLQLVSIQPLIDLVGGIAVLTVSVPCVKDMK